MGFWSNLKERGKKKAETIKNDERPLEFSSGWGRRNVPTVMAAGALGMAAGGAIKGAAHEGILQLRSHNTAVFLVIAAFLHFALVGRNATVFSFADPILYCYVLLAVLAAWLFYNDERDPAPLAHLWKFMLISLFSYALPVLLMIGAERGIIPLSAATLLLFAAPGWIIFIFLNPGESKITKFLAALFFIAWTIIIIVLLLRANLLPESEIRSLAASPAVLRDTLAQLIAGARTLVIDAPVQAYNNTKNFFTGQINYATQEYYTGTVDQTQGAPIGVFITELTPLYQRFRTDTDDIIVTATLNARTFSDNITIHNGCYLEVLDTTDLLAAAQRNVTGDVQPERIDVSFTGEFQEKHGLDCTVVRAGDSGYRQYMNTTRVHSGTVVFNSTFDFETWGYAEIGFMDRGLMQAFRLENHDPANVLGISPVIRPKYTPGPIMLGMPSDSQPVSFDSVAGEPHLPGFGFTLTNGWMGKGQVNHFRSIEFFLPKPFVIDEGECTPRDVEIIRGRGAIAYDGPVDWDENSAYNKYTVRNVGIRSTESFITIRCPMTIDESQETSYPVLGSSGASKFTFFVHADYSYTTWSRAPVLIQGVAS